jgi:hypothetical protein
MSAYAISSHSCLALGVYVHEKKGLPLLTLTNITTSGLSFSLVRTTVRETGNITESTVGTVKHGTGGFSEQELHVKAN